MPRNREIDIQVIGTVIDFRDKKSVRNAKRIAETLIDNTNEGDRLVIVYLKAGIVKELRLEGNEKLV